VFEGYSTTTPQDARHLFGPAAAIFGEPSWAALGGDAGAWEAAWWGLESAPADAMIRSTPIARLFPQAGVAVARTTTDHYLLVTNGVVGTNGFGNHKHNDLLSFEYHRGGTPLIVDPGSYVYTSDGEARNRFRGTAQHNTLMVDGVEQNELRPDWLFRLFETSHAESIAFDDRTDFVEYVGRHHGYERLADPVTHERTFRFVKTSGDLTIVDRLTGRGRHDVRWHFHLAPGVAASHGADACISLAAHGSRWTLRMPAGVSVVIVPAEYSPSYGVKVPCLAVDVSSQVELAVRRSWEFSIVS
jgi:hypothetical protein